MTLAKVLRIPAGTSAEAENIAALLQEFLEKAAPADVCKLLTAFKKNPSVLKTAIKWL